MLVHFGVATVPEAARLIKKMPVPDLKARFMDIYEVPTNSGNGEWLRKKLYEALGLNPRTGRPARARDGRA